jgi:hypothetical protein
MDRRIAAESQRFAETRRFNGPQTGALHFGGDADFLSWRVIGI